VPRPASRSRRNSSPSARYVSAIPAKLALEALRAGGSGGHAAGIAKGGETVLDDVVTANRKGEREGPRGAGRCELDFEQGRSPEAVDNRA